MSASMSKGRAWAICAIITVAFLVALGLGLGLGLNKEEKEIVVEVEKDCPEVTPPTSARLTKDSPIYVEPTYTKEGAYRYVSAASDSEICSKIGTEIMVRQGGSAVDAAIAAILCASINNIQSCGVGGGFFMTYYKRSEKKAYSIMAREMAPGNASQDMFLAEGVSSREGGMAIGIPGEVKGLYEAWRLGGKLPWSDLFQPAIKMCRDGNMVGKLLGGDIQKNKDYFARHQNLRNMLTNPETGELYKEGEKIRFPKLADTFEKIAADPHAFYNGSLANEVSQDIIDQGGIITVDDLKAYTAAVKDSLELSMTGDYTVYTAPPPSSGAVLLLIMNILNGYNFDESSIENVDKTVDTFHKIIESFKHGFAARTNLGDSDAENQTFADNIKELVQNMTSPTFGESRRARITNMAHETEYYKPSFSFGGSDTGTSHISVLGPNGDAVTITSTVNLYFGSKVVGTRTGIVFNDQMDDFSTPGTVNFFGIPASPANFIKPYKRPMSSIAPTIVVDKNGDVKLVTGASGGSRIITATALSAMHTLWFKLGMKEAIDYPRVHHQLVPPTVRVETRLPQAILDGLTARGHTFDMQESSSSAVQAILQAEKDKLFAACDPTKYGVPDGA